LDSILLSREHKLPYSSRVFSGNKATARDRLIKEGLLVDDGNCLFITAPVVQNVLIRNLHGPDQPLNGQTTLDDFLIETLKRLSRSALASSRSIGEDDHLLERQWQMEFYRAVSVLGAQHHISPDFGTSDGWIDFYVDNELEWGIELLREGYKLGQHASRFEEDGAYASLGIDPKKSVILDFRSVDKKPQQRRYCVPVWYVMYDKDYTKLTIRRKGQLDLCGAKSDH